ncbi:MAG: tryptophan synthase subunit beta [Deltaproteobacteria bacterium]|nr:tryptophan synthase subunit beta [Deltaproteobacteria bacterium]
MNDTIGVGGPGFRLDRRPFGDGLYGEFGGRFVSETLQAALADLTEAWLQARSDPTFLREYLGWAADFAGRPTPLSEARRLSEALGLRIFLKREDLAHTGAHKINNCLGQALLARQLGKSRIIAETGAGQHGVATATVAAALDLPCCVYMGSVDVERQAPNVRRMELLGAEVRPVTSGSATLKDAMNAALRDWVSNVEGTHYLIGSAAGPHPYPTLVRELQSVIGWEARAQLAALGLTPDAAVACVGGGSNAIGLFDAFLDDPGVRLFGAEAAGRGLESGEHAATLSKGSPGVLHGARSYLLQDEDGQVELAHSISAGLDYPGVGPQHAHLAVSGRATYHAITDDEALAALRQLARLEGIVPALETAHALALLPRVARELAPGAVVLLGLSGRGDKDLPRLEEEGGAL